MHYKLRKGIVVKTENAAKSDKQPSAFLAKLIEKLPPVSDTFDYGCGKLRYMDSIRKTTNALVLVDSEIQLSRAQILKGSTNSIRGYVGRSNSISVYSDVEFAGVRQKFDRGFCINVLRKRVLETIRTKLRKGAPCLFVAQYRNSDFDRMKRMANAKPWLDGFLIDSLRGYSFYGLIAPDRLSKIVSKAGFVVRDVELNEGSVYLWAVPGR
jgi:hypothetical protein